MQTAERNHGSIWDSQQRHGEHNLRIQIRYWGLSFEIYVITNVITRAHGFKICWWGTIRNPKVWHCNDESSDTSATNLGRFWRRCVCTPTHLSLPRGLKSVSDTQDQLFHHMHLHVSDNPAFPWKCWWKLLSQSPYNEMSLFIHSKKNLPNTGCQVVC